MAFTHAPLEEAQLGPGVWKVVGPDAPAPMQMMAARGLAPLAPRDLLVTLYHFWVTNTPKLGDEAGKTIDGLPPAILGGALDDPQLPPGVLDFVARKLPRKEDVLDRIVRHPQADNETLAAVARVCPESICDVMAENQQRWLEFPAIVESLYQNPNCRMSVVHRMIELAIRQGIDLRLPNIEEIKAALGDGVPPSEDEDDAFKRAVGGEVQDSHSKMVERLSRTGVEDELLYDATTDNVDGELDIEALLNATPLDDMSLPMGEEDEAPAEDKQPEAPPLSTDRLTQIGRLPVMHKIRLALLGNAFERSVLIRDSNKMVALSAIKSPRVKENEVIAFSAQRALGHEVIREIARKREWVKLYQVKLNLVLNPKTPLSNAMSILGQLHPHDVRKVARSRNIPNALAQAAKRKVAQRR